MNAMLTEVLVHLEESVDEATLDRLETGIRATEGVVSVGHRPGQAHLMMVVYDSSVARASAILHNFQERGLHARLVGM